MDMSRYQRQLLREDDSFVLYRGISEDGNNSVLMKASVSTELKGLQRLKVKCLWQIGSSPTGRRNRSLSNVTTDRPSSS
jgi:hypothetical protein